MTYSSLNVRAYPTPLSQAELEAAGLGNAVVMKLDHVARDCGPYGLADWAKERGLPIYYVDNCWVRVAVSKQELWIFLADVLGISQLEPLADPGPFLIEAEEF
jgi:hypothetical protein